jgi:peptidoglycan hydrolase-like amidase
MNHIKKRKTSIKFAAIIAAVALVISLLTTNHPIPTTISAEPNCSNPSFGEIDTCLERIKNEINALKPANEYNRQELTGVRSKIGGLETTIKAIEKQLKDVRTYIEKREEDLQFAQIVFEEKTANYYKLIRLYDPLLPFLSAADASSALKELIFRQKATGHDINTMNKFANDLTSLKSDKENLEKNVLGLSTSKNELSKKAAFLSQEVAKTESHLASLSAKQEQLVALKSAGFQISIGDTPPTAEPCSGPPGSGNFCDPGFRPAFAAFSFGAPHRTGMSQYGAYGRSQRGQTVETILSAYYQGAQLNKNYPVPDTIGVNGIGRVSFEDNYLLGIYEVPESWGNNGGFEALKAQAIAARSYALAVTNGGAGSICTTESCQVYKPQLKTGKWAEAVRATRGWVLTINGAPAKTYYSSTTGGYTITNWGWTGIKDTEGDWPSTAYERISGSPWFYKGWYRSRGGASCGRSHPWLTSTEMADVLNAWHVVTQGGGDAGRVSPIDTNCWGGNPYSVSELASIGGFTSVSGVSVVYSNTGITNQVTLTTNKGTISMSGSDLRKAFNLRAPGYIGIKSGLFNMEKL